MWPHKLTSVKIASWRKWTFCSNGSVPCQVLSVISIIARLCWYHQTLWNLWVLVLLWSSVLASDIDVVRRPFFTLASVILTAEGWGCPLYESAFGSSQGVQPQKVHSGSFCGTFQGYWAKKIGREIIERLERLRSRFFGISREPRTSRSHVTTALASGLQFEVHVFTARPRSRGKWLTAWFFVL